MLLYTFSLSFFACLFISFPALTPFPYVDPKPISVYHPTSEETPTTTSTPMEGFFDGPNAVAEAMASASAATEYRAPAEASIPPFEPIFAEEGTQAERVVT